MGSGSSTAATSASPASPACEVHDDGTTVTFGPPHGNLLPPAPRVIWSFWDKDDVPDLVRACAHSWRLFHPDFAVVMLKPSSLPALGLDLDKDFAWATTPARKADVVRCHVVAAYGGVWLDASMLLSQPLAFVQGVLTERGPDFTGFFIARDTQPCWPVVENWAFAARPGAVFMQRWRTVFFDVPNHAGGVREALHELVHVKHVNVRAIGGTHYLFMHVAAQAVLQQAPHNLSLHVFSANSGPFRFLQDHGWSSRRGVEALLVHYHPRTPGRYGAYKLRRHERRVMTDTEAAEVLSRVLGASAH